MAASHPLPGQRSLGRAIGASYVLSAMLALKPVPPPLDSMPDGAIRVAGTRVSLETVVFAFDAGATAEEIAQQYPSLLLADIYAVISYILVHRRDVDEYVRTRTARASALRAQAEQRAPRDGIRARLLARRRAETAG
jgi:uncharacterized protein (DUF433 family)